MQYILVYENCMYKLSFNNLKNIVNFYLQFPKIWIRIASIFSAGY